MTARVTLLAQSQILSFLSSSPPKAPPHSEGDPEFRYALHRPVPFDCRHLLQLAPSPPMSLLCLICSSYKKLGSKNEAFGWEDGMHRGWCLVPRARDPPPGVSCCFHGTSSSCLIAYVEAAIDQLFMTCSCILNGASVLQMSIITCPTTPPLGESLCPDTGTQTAVFYTHDRYTPGPSACPAAQTYPQISQSISWTMTRLYSLVQR